MALVGWSCRSLNYLCIRAIAGRHGNRHPAFDVKYANVTNFLVEFKLKIERPLIPMAVEQIFMKI